MTDYYKQLVGETKAERETKLLKDGYTAFDAQYNFDYALMLRPTRKRSIDEYEAYKRKTLDCAVLYKDKTLSETLIFENFIKAYFYQVECYLFGYDTCKKYRSNADFRVVRSVYVETDSDSNKDFYKYHSHVLLQQPHSVTPYHFIYALYTCWQKLNRTDALLNKEIIHIDDIYSKGINGYGSKKIITHSVTERWSDVASFIPKTKYYANNRPSQILAHVQRQKTNQ